MLHDFKNYEVYYSFAVICHNKSFLCVELAKLQDAEIPV